MALIQPLIKPIQPKINWQNSLTHGLVWDADFWEGGGIIVRDLVNSGIGDGTGDVVYPATWDKGLYGTDLDFSAAGSTVNYFTPSNVTSLKSLTVEMLANVRGAGGGNIARLFQKKAGTNNGYFNFIYDTSGTPVLRVAAAFSTTTRQVQVTWTTDGLWHQFLFTIDDNTSISATTNVYIDGILQTLSQNQAGVGTTVGDDTNLYIGNRSDAIRTFNGKISYMRIWNRVLTTTEIWSLYANPWQIYVKPSFNPYYNSNPVVTVTDHFLTLMGAGT